MKTEETSSFHERTGTRVRRAWARSGTTFKVLLLLGSAAVAIGSLVLIGVLALLSRPLGLLVLALGVVAFVVSRRFRGWVGFDEFGPALAHGLRLPSEVMLHPRHAWVRRGRRKMTVGADDLVQRALGRVERVSLPAVGQHVGQGEALFRVGRGEREITVKAPIDGTVVRVNDALTHEPDRINDQPYHMGWVVQMHPRDFQGDRRSLVTGPEARRFLSDQVDRLIALASSGAQTAPVLQDGGPLVEGIGEHVDEETWSRIRDGLFGA